MVATGVVLVATAITVLWWRGSGTDVVIDVPEESVSASVTVTGTGPPDELIMVTGGMMPLSTAIGLDGTFEMEVGLRPDTSNTLEVRMHGSSDLSATAVVDQQIDQARGVVVGTVRSSDDGEPIAGARISYGSITATSRSDGSFRLRDVPDGWLLFQVFADGHLAGIGEAHVREGLGDAGVTPLTRLAEPVEVGPEGETIEGDGWRVEIPAGAVIEPTLIHATTLRPTGMKDTIGFPIVDLSPTGLTFERPISVSYDPAGYGLEPADIDLVGLDPDTLELHDLDERVDGELVSTEITTLHGLELRLLPDGPWNKWGGQAALCTEFNQVTAFGADQFLKNFLIPFLAVKISGTSSLMYATYLTAAPESDERKSANSAADEFRKAPETLAFANVLLDSLLEVGLPELQAPASPATFRVQDQDPERGFRAINFGEIYSTPGNLAGGPGKAFILGRDVPDERLFTGTVEIVPEANERGVITKVSMVADLHLRVTDAIDFCPKGYGNPGEDNPDKLIDEQLATLALSRLEVTPFARPSGGLADVAGVDRLHWATRILFEADTDLDRIIRDVTVVYANDPDEDGWPDYAPWPDATVPLDNCPGVANADQEDVDNDKLGDVCDPEVEEPAPQALDCSAGQVAPNDDGFSPEVELPFELDFYGQKFSTMWVNNNGNVTFDEGLSTFTPFALAGSEQAIIAPFFADVDTRGAGTVRYGPAKVGDADAFCVSWDSVGYYDEHTELLNSFSLYLIERDDVRPGAFDIVFLYDFIEWETGDASDGEGGFGGTPAVAGWSNGTGSAEGSFQLPGSLTSRALVNGGSHSLSATATNAGSNGQHIWEIK